MDIASAAGTFDCSEVSLTTMASGPSPSASQAAADLLEEVGKLVQKHQEEVSRCFETWLQTCQVLQPPLPDPQPAGVCDWCQPFERPGVPMAPPPEAAASSAPHSQELQPYAVMCSENSFMGSSSNNLLGMHGHPKDTLASQVAGKKRRKRRPARRSELVHPVQAICESATRLQRLTMSRPYEMASGTLIILNAVFIGWQVQFLALRAEEDAAADRPLRRDTPAGFVAMQVIFLLLFTVELGLRWACEGVLDFFRNGDAWWNVLDIVVVSFSFVDTLIDIAIESDSEFVGNISVLRVLRVVRVIRVAKVIRIMRFFRELRMMLFSILGSMKSLLWVMLVLAMVFYVFGITFTSAVSTALDTTAQWRNDDTEALRFHFATIDRSLLSLFMAMSGGNDWAVYYDALDVLPAQYRLLFLLFIAFSLFAVVNIVTGVFVESAMQSNSADRDIIVHEELEAKKTYLKSMREVFDEMDEDDTGCISMEEFEKKLDDERVRAYFNALKLDVTDARVLFRLLDYDRSQAVNIDEFLTGCYRLQGESRSLDMKIMQCEVRYMQEHFITLLDSLHEIRAAVRSIK
mmetsp:Transcript_21577/g.61105  ORF Transcript_21577/g.61105 Transcript_21577/m.61105 type:complete len:575 (-) Transcript_21577:311-2035(-)